uniref:Uncharacterized protein n=1 Tax=Anguilla anguilla TaxID=7936 RepID=A0A0E9W465_ANGAN
MWNAAAPLDPWRPALRNLNVVLK